MTSATDVGPSLAPIAFSTATDVPADSEVLAVPVFSGFELAPGTPVELDFGFLEGRDFDAEVGQAQPLVAGGGRTVVAVGLGDRGAVDLEALRRAAGAAVKAAWKATTLATTLVDAAPPGLGREAAAQAVAEGMVLGTYQFTTYKSTPKPCALESVTLVGAGSSDLQSWLERGARVAGAVALARDLVNEPARAVTPRRLEAVAREVAEREGLEVTVYDEVDIVNERLGGLAGVAAGSEEPARLIQLVYSPPEPRATVALVGKGITFDSGGLSIKTSDGMMTMKCDMGGAAAVIAAMSAVAAAGGDVKVIGLAACTENLPSGRAIKPGDVLEIRNGKTVEVLNTDAEGRLVLADALSLAVEAAPDAIVDLATLTGACTVALGNEIAGLMSNHAGLAAQVEAAAQRAGEPVWPLPLPKRYRRHIDSEVADIKNIGAAHGKGGALTAGLFLQEFVDGRPWVHLDIAGPAFRDEADTYLPKGGTGFGVRTILELLAAFEKPAPPP
ncbi:MAG: leucyl aminopeptidase [Actinobacteria bacterium]|nr:leucyl aminopeptidase [Actinomycetota bacterium]